MQGYSYYAFISYSRKNEAWARWVQRKLESYRFPSALRKNNQTLPKKLFPVFRDKTDLVSGELWETLKHQLTESQFLIVICTPDSANSPWVNNEIAYFRSLGRNRFIIPLIVEGEPYAADPARECFGPELKRGNAAELLGVSVRELGKKKALLRLIATMTQLRFDALVQRDRLRRRKRTAVAVAAALLLTAGAAAGFRFASYPEKSAAAAAASRTALESFYLDEAVRQGRESVRLLWKKTDEDAGVIALKNALAAKELDGTDGTVRKAFSVNTGVRNFTWIGTSPDGSAVVINDQALAVAYDNKTGKKLNAYKVKTSAQDRAAVAELLQISEEAVTDFEDKAFAEARKKKETLRHTVVRRDGMLVLSENGKEKLFDYQLENDVFFTCNREETVFAFVEKDSGTVHIENLVNGYSVSYDLQGVVKDDSLRLSPAGGYLFIEYADRYLNKNMLALIDVARQIDLAEHLYLTEESFNAIRFHDSLQNEFYVVNDYTLSKYIYQDYTPVNNITAAALRRDRILFSSDGKVFFTAAGSYGKASFCFCEADTGKRLLQIQYGDYTDISCKDFSVDPNMTVAFSNTGKLWNVRTAKLLYEDTQRDYVCVSVNEDGTKAVAADEEGGIYLFEINGENVSRSFLRTLEDTGVQTIAIRGDLMVIGATEMLYFYRFSSKEWEETSESLWGVGYTNLHSEMLHGDLFIFCSYEGDYGFYDCAKKRRIETDTLEDCVYCAASGLLCGEPFANQDQGNRERVVYEYKNGAFKKLYSFVPEGLCSVRFSDDGAYLIFNTENADGEGTRYAQILDAHTGEQLMYIPRYSVALDHETIYGTCVPYLPQKLPRAHFYSTKEIEAYAKQK